MSLLCTRSVETKVSTVSGTREGVVVKILILCSASSVGQVLADNKNVWTQKIVTLRKVG